MNIVPIEIDDSGKEVVKEQVQNKTPEIVNENKGSENNNADAPVSTDAKVDENKATPEYVNPLSAANATDKAPEQEDVFGKTLIEKTNGKYKSLDELLEAANNPKTKYPNEFVEKLSDFVSNGGDPNLFMQINSVDLDKMSAEDKIKQSLRLKNPNLDPDEVDFMFENQFEKPNEDEDDDYERKLKAYNIKIKQALPEADKALSQWKTSALETPAIKQQNDLTQMQQKFEQEIKQVAESMQEVSVKIGADSSFTFKVGQSERQAAFERAKNPNAVLERYVDASGNFDNARYVQDQLVLDNLPHIIHLAIQQNTNTVKEKLLEEVKRPDLKGGDSRTVPNSNGALTLAQQAKANGF